MSTMKQAHAAVEALKRVGLRPGSMIHGVQVHQTRTGGRALRFLLPVGNSNDASAFILDITRDVALAIGDTFNERHGAVIYAGLGGFRQTAECVGALSELIYGDGDGWDCLRDDLCPSSEHSIEWRRGSALREHPAMRHNDARNALKAGFLL